MILKGNVIEQALLNIGNISDYNDTRSKTYQAAETNLKNVCKEICRDTAFRFSQTTVNLTEYVVDDIVGQNRFNIPSDFLGIGIVPKKPATISPYPMSISQIMGLREKKDFRLQGNYIYSKKEVVRFNYVRNVPLEDMPEYLEDYIIWKLAKKLALQFQQFSDHFMLAQQMEREKRTDALMSEGNGELEDYTGGNYE